jgi:hypothetical protein
MSIKRFLLISFSLLFMYGISSCSVQMKRQGTTTTVKTKQGKRGWFKNTNNPHHPNTTNPGRHRGKSNHKTVNNKTKKKR